MCWNGVYVAKKGLSEDRENLYDNFALREVSVQGRIGVLVCVYVCVFTEMGEVVTVKLI